MARVVLSRVTCDAPNCLSEANSESHYSLPPKWSEVTVSINGEDLEDNGCECKCHDYELDEEIRTSEHEDWDCPCEEEEYENRGEFILCESCTASMKKMFIKPPPIKAKALI